MKIDFILNMIRMLIFLMAVNVIILIFWFIIFN